MSDIRCRLCLKASGSKIDVFKDDFPKMIEILTGLEVDPHDSFPQKSCLDCAKNVKLALKTRKQIIQSHKFLLEEFLINCKKTCILEEPLLLSNSDAKDDHKSELQHNIQVKLDNNKYEVSNKPIEVENKLDTTNSTKEECYEQQLSDTLDELDNDYSNASCTPDKKIPKEAIPEAVFFVKKRQKPVKKSVIMSETVVRIKKKPKPRTPPKRVTCDICKREVQSYWLQKHMETHQYNPATCEFCGLVSKSATALRHHVFYYHRSAADEYMCDQCGKNFRSKYRLNLHKKKEHGGTKDFECTTCGKKFFERMHLKRHVDKTHKNIRPYVCDFCGKSFKSKNHIKIHERIHSKEAPYNCHVCGESFKMKLTLRTHLKGVHSIHEEQRVFCDVCNRGFASDVALKAHLNSRVHETEKCQYCSEMFTREYMVKHLKEVHASLESW